MPTASVNQATSNPITARNPNQQGTNTSRGGGKGREMVGSQARVYALTHQEAQTSNNIVTSILKIENLNINALFDHGATNSFISIDLASKMGKPKKELMEVLLVTGKVLPTDKMIEKCEIKIGEVLIEND